MGSMLEVNHGSDGRVRSALVKTEDGKLKRLVKKTLASLFCGSVYREKNREVKIGTLHLGFFSTDNRRDLKLGTQVQVPNTDTPIWFQGQSQVLHPSPLTCVVFKVIVPKCEHCCSPI